MRGILRHLSINKSYFAQAMKIPLSIIITFLLQREDYRGITNFRQDYNFLTFSIRIVTAKRVRLHLPCLC